MVGKVKGTADVNERHLCLELTSVNEPSSLTPVPVSMRNQGITGKFSGV